MRGRERQRGIDIYERMDGRTNEIEKDRERQREMPRNRER